MTIGTRGSLLQEVVCDTAAPAANAALLGSGGGNDHVPLILGLSIGGGVLLASALGLILSKRIRDALMAAKPGAAAGRAEPRSPQAELTELADDAHSA